MSWLGDSINSLTGHLSNIAKEVLNEGIEEVSDHATELSSSNRRLQEVQAQFYTQRQELERVRNLNRELEERCAASDLQVSSLASQYRDELQRHRQQNDQLIQNDNQSIVVEDRLRDATEHHQHQMATLQDHYEERLRQTQRNFQEKLQQQNIQDENEVEDEDEETLRAKRSANVEKRVNDAEVQTMALKDELRDKDKQLQLMNRRLEKLQNSEKSVQAESRLKDEQNKSLFEKENGELVERNRMLEEQLSEIVAALRRKDDELNELADDKASLDSSLVELDSQQQEAMQQVLAQKETLTAANKALTNEVERLREETTRLQTLIESDIDKNVVGAKLKESLDELSRTVGEGKSVIEKLEQGKNALAVELSATQLENVEIKTRLNSILEEKEKLESALKATQEEKVKSESSLSATEVENGQLRSRIMALEKQDHSSVDQFDSSTSAGDFDGRSSEMSVRMNQLSSENENLQNEADDLRSRMGETAGELDRFQQNLEEQRRENDVLRDELSRKENVLEAIESQLEKAEKKALQKEAKDDEEVVELKARVEELRSLLESKTVTKDAQTEVENEINCDSTINDLKAEIVELKAQIERDSATLAETSQLEDTNKRIEELEEMVQLGRSRIEGLETEAGKINDLRNKLQQKESEVQHLLSSQLEQSSLHKDPERTMDKLRQVENEKERLLSVLTEKSRECSGLKMEVHRLFSAVSAEKQALSKLQRDNEDMSKKPAGPEEKDAMKEAVHNLSRIIKDKDIEIEALKQKGDTLMLVVQQQTDGKGQEDETLASLLRERQETSVQLNAYKSDREQITHLLNQKHQESVSYHAEIQRLSGLLTEEKGKYESLREQHSSVSMMFEEKQKSLLNTQNEVVTLKSRVTELERQHLDLRDKYVALTETNPQMVSVKVETLREQEKKSEESRIKIEEGEELLKEKDKMIGELSVSCKSFETETVLKEEEIKSLKRKLENVGFRLNDTESRLSESEEERDDVHSTMDKLRRDNLFLQESNENLTLAIKKMDFERQSAQEKVTAMTQLLEQKSSENGEKLIVEMDLVQLKAQELHRERDQAVLALGQQQLECKEAREKQKKLEDQNRKLHLELDRLRNHLLELEDSFTKDIVEAEEREKTLRNKLAAAEDKAKVSSSAIFNASQESQARADSFQQQMMQILKQRDSDLERNSQLEDQVQETKAAVTNLQSALECLQSEHRRELETERRKAKSVLNGRETETEILRKRLLDAETKFNETSEALNAASRLSEQLDKKERIIEEQKKQVIESEAALRKTQAQMNDLESHTEGKVDKQIMKSLVLGYLSSPNSQKPDVIRLLARILDFNQLEMQKAGLKIGRLPSTPDPSRRGWFSSIIQRVAITPSTPSSPTNPSILQSPSPSIIDRGTSSPTPSNVKSFTSLFVEFLTSESQPRIPARLIPLEDLAGSHKNQSGIQTELFRNGTIPGERPNFANMTSPAAANPSAHLLMRPLAADLPIFAPVASQAQDTFLKDVLE